MNTLLPLSFFKVRGMKRLLSASILAFLTCMSLSLAIPLAVAADTLPPSGTPATVSADPLPTVQINSIVWDQVVVGNTVYAVGSFTQARPAGVALGGPGSVERKNILAYNIRTGELDKSFVHTLTGSGIRIGRAIAVSPDKTKLYIGGQFTHVDGQPRNNLAAISLTTNTLLPNFTGTNGPVKAISATNSRVYVGGSFSQAGNQSRSNLAAYNANGSLDAGWKADVTGKAGSSVSALVTAEPYGNLIVGGSFNKIAGSTYYSSGAVKLSTGAKVKWASQSSSYKLRMQVSTNNLGINASALGITSLSFDGKQVYLTAFKYMQGAKSYGGFEGRAAISPSSGKIIWANYCLGDSYDAVPIGGVLYSVGHPHRCTAIGAYADTNPQMAPPMRALAETTKRTSNKYNGLYYSKLLNWFPQLDAGKVSGASQAAWSIVGNSQYVALGGEFPKANGIPQQGLVRYAIASIAPNTTAPNSFYNSGYGVMAFPATSSGKSTVRIFNASDKDNGKLTYLVYRRGESKLLASKTYESRWWKSKSWSFTDTGIKPGTSLQYTVVIKDGYGNTTTVSDGTLINDSDSRVKYKGSGWKVVKDRGNSYPDFARDIHRTKTNGNSVTLKFTGTSVSLLSERGNNLGTATVSIDGGPATTIDMKYIGYKSDYRYYQAEVYKRTGLSAGTHTIKITKTGGTYLVIDAFKVR